MHHCGCHGDPGAFEDECIMSMSVGDYVLVVLDDDTDWAGAGARCHDSTYHGSGEGKVYGGGTSGDGYVYSRESAMPAAITHACGQNTDLTIKVTKIAAQTFALGDDRNGIVEGNKQLQSGSSMLGFLVQCSIADPPSRPPWPPNAAPRPPPPLVPATASPTAAPTAAPCADQTNTGSSCDSGASCSSGDTITYVSRVEPAISRSRALSLLKEMMSRTSLCAGARGRTPTTAAAMAMTQTRREAFTTNA